MQKVDDFALTSRNNNDKNVQRNASFADGKLNPHKFTKEN